MGPSLRRRISRSGRALLFGAVLGSLLAVPHAHADKGADAPFSIRAHDLPGRILQAWPLSVSICAAGESDLLVLSADGGPPSQRKIVTWMPCGSATEPGDPRIVQRELEADVVFVDVARVPERSGPQLLSVAASGIRIDALEPAPDAPRLEWPVPGGLPFPPRPYGVSRLEIVADWQSTGRPLALVPALAGAWLIDLADGRAKPLPMPIYAEYRSWEPYLPAPIWKWLIQETLWPTLARADDNGDGLLDLFALSRWSIWIYHAGPKGLPSQPSRRIDLVPFDEETERRHEATTHTYFAHDLDRNGYADLLLTTVGGGLMKGRSTTAIHLAGQSSVTLSGPPDALRETEGGFAHVHFEDLDGDGRVELIETTIEFGLVQLVRILVTRRAETKIRVLALDPTAPGGTRVLFEDELAFRLDFGEGKVAGLVPSLGDYNGDGIQDLYVAKGSDEIAFRLGSSPPGGFVFGRPSASQSVPLASGESRVADLDGDGLDEIIAFDLTDPEAPLIVLHNRGRLAGTRPELRAAP